MSVARFSLGCVMRRRVKEVQDVSGRLEHMAKMFAPSQIVMFKSDRSASNSPTLQS